MNTPQLYSMVPMAPSHSTGLPVKSLSRAAAIVLLLSSFPLIVYRLKRSPGRVPALRSGGAALLYFGLTQRPSSGALCAVQGRAAASPGVVQLKNRRIAAQAVVGIFLSALTLTLTACKVLYKTPEYNFAGRP